ncbi:hypothetical protein P5V15_013083 [Pogonomyrmex californicus]
MATTVVRERERRSSVSIFPRSLFLSTTSFLFFLTISTFYYSFSCSSFSSSISSFFFLSYSFSFSFSFSSFSILHRSGKDPPRVALHERVVDEESVKLAL